jgi:DNA-directed RNA polymerase alpha subunit
MVTEKEFLKAIEIVNKYKLQVYNKCEEMKLELNKNNITNSLITKETLISDLDLSVRCFNALRALCLNNEDMKNLKWSYLVCEVTIGHFENIKKYDLYRLRNIGKKSIKEIEEVFLQAGVSLKNN